MGRGCLTHSHATPTHAPLRAAAVMIDNIGASNDADRSYRCPRNGPQRLRRSPTLAKQEELSAQVTADANRCRQGDQSACRLYRMEIQRWSALSTDPVCQNW